MISKGLISLILQRVRVEEVIWTGIQATIMAILSLGISTWIKRKTAWRTISLVILIVILTS